MPFALTINRRGHCEHQTLAATVEQPELAQRRGDLL
jgi:hypothetical protein